MYHLDSPRLFIDSSKAIERSARLKANNSDNESYIPGTKGIPTEPDGGFNRLLAPKVSTADPVECPPLNRTHLRAEKNIVRLNHEHLLTNANYTAGEVVWVLAGVSSRRRPIDRLNVLCPDRDTFTAERHP